MFVRPERGFLSLRQENSCRAFANVALPVYASNVSSGSCCIDPRLNLIKNILKMFIFSTWYFITSTRKHKIKFSNQNSLKDQEKSFEIMYKTL